MVTRYGRKAVFENWTQGVDAARSLGFAVFSLKETDLREYAWSKLQEVPECYLLPVKPQSLLLEISEYADGSLYCKAFKKKAKWSDLAKVLLNPRQTLRFNCRSENYHAAYLVAYYQNLEVVKHFLTKYCGIDK